MSQQNLFESYNNILDQNLDCKGTYSNSWANCILKKIVNEQIAGYNDNYREINQSIEKINNKTIINILNLNSKFSDFINAYNNSNVTSYFGNEIVTFRNNSFAMSEGISFFIEDLINKTIPQVLTSLNNSLVNVTGQMAEHQNIENSVATEMDNIEARLNQTQFVFGTLPLNLTQAISGAPIAIAIGFLIYSILFKELLQIRRVLDKWYQDIYLFAPLWIDPLSKNPKKVIKSLIFSIPFLIFFAICFLITYSFTLCPHNINLLNTFGIKCSDYPCCLNMLDNLEKFFDFDLLNWIINIYKILYVMGFIFFIYGYIIILQDMHSTKGYNKTSSKKITKDKTRFIELIQSKGSIEC